MIYVHNDLPRRDVALGLVRAEQVSVQATPPELEGALARLLEGQRQEPFGEPEERVRQAARDMLRNGRYRPTGRGKPASEYLVRAAREAPQAWPRINAPVDVCNYISLKYLLPISLWDLDLAGTPGYRFRLGRPGEAYVFNEGGQVIDLEDLVVGCRLRSDDPGGDGEPIVNPVKDSLATKTTGRTGRVAACVYTPLGAVPEGRLAGICAEFAALLGRCGASGEVASGVVLPGETKAV
jgi:DNA/RNA-binding domain of Phe-tRNA-synthetase-like protein